MIKNLQSLRFVFCMLIFVFHYTGMTHASYVFTYGGDAGVAFFFMLSGFALSVGHGRKKGGAEEALAPFLLRRFRKLYPLHLAALIAAVAWAAYIGKPFEPGYFVAQTAMLQTWLLTTDCNLYGNAVSWFLCPLFLCYALFQWLYRNIMRRTWTVGFRCIFVAYLVAYTSVGLFSDADIDGFVYAFPPVRVIDFVVGILAYRLYSSPSGDRIRRRVSAMNTVQATIAEFCIVLVCVATWCIYPSVCMPVRFSAMFWLPFSVTILWFAFAEGGRGMLSRLFRQRTMVWLGGISFEIYMIHLISISLCSAVYGKIFGYYNQNLYLLFVCCLVVTVFAAYTVNRVEERLFRKPVMKSGI